MVDTPPNLFQFHKGTIKTQQPYEGSWLYPISIP